MRPYEILTKLPPLLEVAIRSSAGETNIPILYQISYSIQKAWFWFKNANTEYMKEVIESTMEHSPENPPEEELKRINVSEYELSMSELTVNMSYLEKELTQLTEEIKEITESGQYSSTVNYRLCNGYDNLMEALFDVEILLTTLQKTYE